MDVSSSMYEDLNERQGLLESDTGPSDRMEPIAVIGLALKFPQTAVNADTFWEMLIKGRSAMTEVPKDRFNVEAFYHSDATRANAVCTPCADALT